MHRVAHGGHPITACGWRDGADGLAGLVDTVPAGCRIEFVHLAAHDVDEDERAAGVVPDGTFGEIGLEIEDDVDTHAQTLPGEVQIGRAHV